jgi:hypothetical protein
LQADKCLNRPKCESFDFHNIFGEDCTNGTTKIEREQIKPTICIAQNDVPLFKVDSITLQIHSFKIQKKVSCSECPLGLHRSDDGICRRCSGENEYVPLGGSKCEKCSNGYTADHGIFITRWNQLPPELNTDCEYFALGKIELYPYLKFSMLNA